MIQSQKYIFQSLNSLCDYALCFFSLCNIFLDLGAPPFIISIEQFIIEGFNMKKVKKIKQVDTQNIRKFVINRNSKDNRQTLQTSISANRPFLIRRSRSQQIPLLVISYQLNQSKRESLTVTEQFLKKAEHEKVHPIPSAFSLIKIEKKEKKLEYNEYQSLKFSILSYTNSKLIDVAVDIVTKFGLLQFSSRLAINRLIKQIQLGYNVVSYHHFAHGFSLMHMYYHLVKMDKKFRSLFTKQEIGFTLIAALAHDLNHKGNNNAFQIKINSELSISANKQSVLQKMHIKTFFNILKGKNISLLQKSKNPRKNKELIIRAILSTDVAKHFKGVQQLKQLRQKNQFDPTNNQHRYFAMEQAFHACDIGNPCLQFQDYINWAALLTYEFDYQTAMEAKKGVEVTQMLRYKGIKQFYSGQIGFINFLAYPLWKQLSGIWSGFTPLVSNIQKNLKILKQKETQNTL